MFDSSEYDKDYEQIQQAAERGISAGNERVVEINPGLKYSCKV